MTCLHPEAGLRPVAGPVLCILALKLGGKFGGQTEVDLAGAEAGGGIWKPCPPGAQEAAGGTPDAEAACRDTAVEAACRGTAVGASCRGAAVGASCGAAAVGAACRAAAVEAACGAAAGGTMPP